MKKYITKFDTQGVIAVDDTILVKDELSTAGSRMLYNFKPLFSAEAVTRLENAGYTLAGKTNTGEFGLDLMGEFSYFNEGGFETAAAAKLVKSGEIKAALNVDVNGAPLRGAAQEGVVFIKPTYGTVSRYGVIAAACSGEQIGVTAENADTAAEILGVISGNDKKDGTSLPTEKYNYTANEAISGKKAALITELYEAADDAVKKTIDESIAKLEAQGVTVEKVSLPMVKEAPIAWQVLMSAELCNNVSRYDGIKFGYRTPSFNNLEELYTNTRTEAFNLLTKTVILYGSDVLAKGRYFVTYEKALRVRRVVYNAVKALLADYDALIKPAMSFTELAPYDIKEAFTKTLEEGKFTCLTKLTGLPEIAAGGISLIADSFKESVLLSLAKGLER